MDACIKNIDDESWRAFKAESARNGMKMGELFGALIKEHIESKETKMGNAKEILFGKKTLTNKDAENIKKAMKEFREGFKFR